MVRKFLVSMHKYFWKAFDLNTFFSTIVFRSHEYHLLHEEAEGSVLKMFPDDNGQKKNIKKIYSKDLWAICTYMKLAVQNAALRGCVGTVAVCLKLTSSLRRLKFIKLMRLPANCIL